MHRVMRAASDGGAGLFIGCVGMPDGNDHSSFFCGVNTWHGAEQLWRKRQNPRISTCSGDKPGQQFRRRKPKPLGRMYAASELAQKWSFEMYAQHLSARLVRVMLHGDIFGNALGAPANIIRASGHRGGHEGSSAVTSEGLGDNVQRFRRGFHHIAPTGAVDVHIDESGNGGFICGGDFSGAVREVHPFTWADQFDDPVAHEYSSVRDIACRRQRLFGVNQSGSHGPQYIVAETLRCTKRVELESPFTRRDYTGRSYR